MKKQLEILVVEDNETYRNAAEQARPEDLRFTYVQTFCAGEAEIASGKYAGAIIDLEFSWICREDPIYPQFTGKVTLSEGFMQPSPHGFELAKVAQEYRVPYVIFTGGLGGHEQTSARILLEEGIPGTVTPAKSNPQGWKEAIDFLRKISYLEENFAARERYRRATGKVYQAQRRGIP